MSILTKIFVVALVVLSLLLSAATITFVNSIDDFKRTDAAQEASLAQAEANLSAAKSAAAAEKASLEEQKKAAEDALAAKQKQYDDAIAKAADLGSQVARANSGQTASDANVTKLTAALNASEATKAQLLAAVTDLRTNNERLLTQKGDLDVAYADASNKLSVTEEARRVLAEQLTELRTQLDKVSGALRDRGVDPTRIAASGLTAGAPPINGYISNTKAIAGIPHATISVGSEDAVKIGMEFNILDRTTGTFLGKLKIVAVEPSQAVGQISGPGAQQVAVGAEVRTQL